jgi:soluble lytic murein transglycosylase-like protein
MHVFRLYLYHTIIILFSLFFSFSLVNADIYRFKDENGVWHFTNIRSDRRYRLYIRTKNIKGKQYIIHYDTIIKRAAKEFDVEPTLIKSIIMAESSFDPNAISHRGAQGLMQLMPPTADDMKVRNPFDPEENIFGGTKYLSFLLKKFKHDKKLAIAAYNIGPSAVDKANSIPRVPQTMRFVKKVLRYYSEFKRQGDQKR